METNYELELARKFVYFTNRNVFLTGKAGTGKTTFLHQLKQESLKRMVVVAPTGVAAINAGGVTVHSFFQMPFGPMLCERVAGAAARKEAPTHKINRTKINIIRSLDLLVIDEISMVRADMLDGIDEVLRRYKDRSKPFGGVQLLMIGDMQQLPPVVKDDEWQLLSPYYDTYYFFGSKALRESYTISIELKHIFRQSDNVFIGVLNEIRNNKLSKASADILNTRYKQGFRDDKNEGYINLTTHNHSANKINEEALSKIDYQSFTYHATIEGDFPEHAAPADIELELKKGAQVMFIKNDSSFEKRFYNGKIGEITAIGHHFIEVRCKGDEETIDVDREEWKNIRYKINDKTKEVEENIVGTFKQYPLRLAWAITIHKSQGLTFEKAIIDAQAAFAHGQTYVALSRCKSLEGLVLSTQLHSGSIISDSTIQSFSQQIEDNPPDDNSLSAAQRDYQLSLLEELFSFKQISYLFDRQYRTSREHYRVIHGRMHELLQEIQKPALEELRNIGEKFLQQIRSLIATETNPEENKALQERIKKASDWFYNKLSKEVCTPFEAINWDTDNKGIHKSLKETEDKIREQLNLKEFCLKSCMQGFVIKEYLNERAKALLEEPPKSKKPKNKNLELSDSSPNHQKLFQILKEWRREMADEADIPHYMVLTQKAMGEIVEELPVTFSELKEIHGIGKKKIESLGEEILDIMRAFCKKNELKEVPEDMNDLPAPKAKKAAKPKKPKQPKGSSNRISLELFQQGKTIAEIAEERNFAQSTIEGHLAWCVRRGMLKLSDKLLKKEKEKAIRAWHQKSDSQSATEARETLGEDYSFSEIRYVVNSILFETEGAPDN